MVRLACALLAIAACNHEPAPPPPPAKPAAPPQRVLGDIHVPACDAVEEAYQRFRGCTAIKPADRVQQDANLEHLRDVLAHGEEAERVASCQGQAATLDQLSESAGC